MTKSAVIVISGKIGSGKDHVTNLIAGFASRHSKYEKYRNIEMIRFADPIKRGIAGMFGHHEDFLYNDPNKRLNSPFYDNSNLPITYGKLHQHFGDAMRKIDIDIFVNVVISKINTSLNKLVIVPDLRFINEFNRLREYKAVNVYKKFIFIKLIGQYNDKYEDGRDSNHQSETEVDELPNHMFDYNFICKYTDKETMKNTIKQMLIKEYIL